MQGNGQLPVSDSRCILLTFYFDRYGYEREPGPAAATASDG
jgi:hypothetical protein